MEAMTRETKLGLLLTLCLVMGVGIIVCDYLDVRPHDNADMAINANDTLGGASNQSTRIGGGKDLPAAEAHHRLIEPRQLAEAANPRTGEAGVREEGFRLPEITDLLLVESGDTREPIVGRESRRQEPKDLIYTVQKNDRLWSIAEKFYGSGTKYKLITRANPKTIKNQIIHQGDKIRIPGVKSKGNAGSVGVSSGGHVGADGGGRLVRNPYARKLIGQLERKSNRRLRGSEIKQIQEYVASYKTLASRYGGSQFIPSGQATRLRDELQLISRAVLAAGAGLVPRRGSGGMRDGVGGGVRGVSGRDSGRGVVAKKHKVARGELLWHIAKQYFGDGRQWTKIRDANRGRVSAKGQVREGVVLIIPSLGH